MPDILNQKVSTPAGDAPVVPVLLVATGAYLAWFGVHYWRSDTAWPSDPVKAVLTGKAIPVPDRSADQAALRGIVAGAQGTAGGQGAILAPVIPKGGGTLTKEQIKLLWVSNGGAESKANLAAAVALQESSGRTGITSPNPDGGTNVGLWQLDTRGVGAGHTVAELSDATTNARITIMATANGTNWSRWEAYTSGAYKKFL